MVALLAISVVYVKGNFEECMLLFDALNGWTRKPCIGYSLGMKLRNIHVIETYIIKPPCRKQLGVWYGACDAPYQNTPQVAGNLTRRD